jgi:hypothetical protein
MLRRACGGDGGDGVGGGGHWAVEVGEVAERRMCVGKDGIVEAIVEAYDCAGALMLRDVRPGGSMICAERA